MQDETFVDQATPRQVLLFSGHMIDDPGRREPRFPPDKVDVATGAIAALLDELGTGSDDLALCGGACGGDLIFAEQCLKRGVKLRVLIPVPEPEFVVHAVCLAGDDWRRRFEEVIRHENCRLLVLSRELGELPRGMNPFEQNNLWLLDTALSWGAEKVRFIALWNRQGGDGPGGTEHMIETVRMSAGQTYLIDTTALW